jgi:hypothetical protein
MKLTDPIDYITLGGRIRYLAGRVKGNRMLGDNFILSNLLWLRRTLETMGFTVSCNLFDTTLKGVVKQYEALEVNSVAIERERLSAQQAEALTKAMLHIETTVLSEAKIRIIALPDAHRFAPDDLLYNPGKILGEGIYELLSPLAQNDISFSCRCIAFECPTAAAFHMLRAVEECVRVLYKGYFPKGDDCRLWEVLTYDLQTKPRKPNPDETLLSQMDHTRLRFKNPTDHPDKQYGLEEAEDLLHISIDIINRCMRDEQVMKKRR